MLITPARDPTGKRTDVRKVPSRPALSFVMLPANYSVQRKVVLLSSYLMANGQQLMDPAPVLPSTGAFLARWANLWKSEFDESGARGLNDSRCGSELTKPGDIVAKWKPLSEAKHRRPPKSSLSSDPSLNNNVLLAQVWQAASAKARELGWIA